MDGYEDQSPITSINRRTVFEKGHEDAEDAEVPSTYYCIDKTDFCYNA